MLDTILLTWTIQIIGQPDHQIRSTDVRLQQYLANITKYIVDSPFRQIIFCENSASDISKERKLIEWLAQLYHKKIELLQFAWDTKKTNQQGRGFGESEIMEYAINHSSLLELHQPFIKMTWRYFLTNTYHFVQHNHESPMFVRMTPFKPRCSTACYVCTPLFYREYLRWIGEKVDDQRGKNYQLEWVFAHLLSKYRSSYHSFNILPIFSATTWSGYVLQPGYVKDTIKQRCNTLWLFKL